MPRLTRKDLQRAGVSTRRRSKHNVDTSPEGVKRRRYNDRVYDSQFEREVAEWLNVSGQNIAVIPQPSVYLRPHDTYKPDFLVVPADGSRPYFVEVKGMVTRRFKRLMEMWPDYGPLDMEVWTRSSSGIHPSNCDKDRVRGNYDE